MNINFNSTSAYKKNLISDLLLHAYEQSPNTTENDKKSFMQFDDDLAEHPQWVGKYVFITTIDDEPVGFVSFDPRQRPNAIIGHNCVLPSYKGKGIGKQQMAFALEEIKKQDFAKVIVSTGTDSFFVPAQKMYVACGFKETGKFYNEAGVEMIGYELALDS